MTFSELSDAIDMPVEDMLKNLRQNKIKAAENEIIIDVADRNDITPLELFEKMKTVKKLNKSSKYYGSGFGRKTLVEVCRQLEIPLERALQRLKDAGVMTTKEAILKDIASENSKNPIDIMEIIDPKR
jgi:hypothetical protein